MDDMIEIYRAALVWNPESQIATVDMDRAREIHRDNLRKMRTSLFAGNDLRLRDALIDGDTQWIAACIVRRDELRKATDFTPIKAAKTLEELHIAIPKVLLN